MPMIYNSLIMYAASPARWHNIIVNPIFWSSDGTTTVSDMPLQFIYCIDDLCAVYTHYNALPDMENCSELLHYNGCDCGCL